MGATIPIHTPTATSSAPSLQVSGLMLANHTSIAYLFERIMRQFDKLYDKRAFLDNYKRQPMFEDGFEEVSPCSRRTACARSGDAA